MTSGDLEIKPKAWRVSHRLGPIAVGTVMTIACGLGAVGVSAAPGPLASSGPAAESVVGTASVFVPVDPFRVLDTRPAPNGPIGVATATPMRQGQTIDLQLAGPGGVLPSIANAALINITLDADATLPSFITVWPRGESRPLASANNAQPGQVVANSMLAKLGQGGGISIFNQQGAVNVVVDVVGYTIALADAGFDSGGHLLSGVGAPTAEIGDDRDFYLDESNADLYGPKAEGDWPTDPFALTGAVGPAGPAGPDGPAGPPGSPGAPGAPGSQITTGTSVPNNADGAEGDLYVDTSTGTLYSKSGGSWIANPTSIRGPQGSPGTNGTDGTNGTNGTNGTTFTTGTTDPINGTGANGDVYVNLTTGVVWTNNGGTWVSSSGSVRGVLGGASRFSVGGITIGVGVLTSGASRDVSFNNEGPEFGTVSTPADGTTFVAARPGVYEVTYELGLGLSVVGAGTVQVLVNGVPQGPGRNFAGALLALDTDATGSVLVQTSTPNAEIKLRVTNTSVVSVGLTLGTNSFVNVTQLFAA